MVLGTRRHCAGRVNLERADLGRMRVAQLKQLLADRGVACRECVEKADFVKRLQSLVKTEL